MNVAYQLACKVYGVEIPDLQDPKVMNDPKIRKFMEKVDWHPDEEYEKEWARVTLEDPVSNMVKVELKAKGKTLIELCEGRMENVSVAISLDFLYNTVSIANYLNLDLENLVGHTTREENDNYKYAFSLG